MSGCQAPIKSLNKIKREIYAFSVSKGLECSIFWSRYWCSSGRGNYKRRNLGGKLSFCSLYWVPVLFQAIVGRKRTSTGVLLSANGPNILCHRHLGQTKWTKSPKLEKTQWRKVQAVPPYYLIVCKWTKHSLSHLGQRQVQLKPGNKVSRSSSLCLTNLMWVIIITDWTRFCKWTKPSLSKTWPHLGQEQPATKPQNQSFGPFSLSQTCIWKAVN